jgi:hypothetical protein
MLPRMDPDRGRLEIIAGPTFACKTEEMETAGTRRFQRFPREEYKAPESPSRPTCSPRKIRCVSRLPSDSPVVPHSSRERPGDVKKRPDRLEHRFAGQRPDSAIAPGSEIGHSDTLKVETRVLNPVGITSTNAQLTAAGGWVGHTLGRSPPLGGRGRKDRTQGFEGPGEAGAQGARITPNRLEEREVKN